MKTIIWMFAVLMLSTGMVKAKEATPNLNTDLQSRLAAFQQATVARDVAGLISFVHPGLFTQIPQEQVIKMMTEAFTDGKAPVVKRMDILSVSPIQPYSRGVFALIGTLQEMEMKRPGDSTPEIDALMIDLIKKRMGTDVEISIDQDKNLVMIKKRSWLIALHHGQARWVFIEKDRLGFFIQNRLLPEDLVAQLK